MSITASNTGKIRQNLALFIELSRIAFLLFQGFVEESNQQFNLNLYLQMVKLYIDLLAHLTRFLEYERLSPLLQSHHPNLPRVQVLQ